MTQKMKQDAWEKIEDLILSFTTIALSVVVGWLIGVGVYATALFSDAGSMGALTAAVVAALGASAAYSSDLTQQNIIAKLLKDHEMEVDVVKRDD